MARTLKDEHKSDGWHVGHRLERQARPSGRDAAAFASDLALDEGPRPTSRQRLNAWFAQADALLAEVQS